MPLFTVTAGFELSRAAEPVAGVFDFERVHGRALFLLFGYTAVWTQVLGEDEATSCRSRSLRGHQDCERQLDDLFVLVDGVQGAAHVVGDVSLAAGLDPIRKLHDGGFEGELVFVDLVQQGGEQV